MRRPKRVLDWGETPPASATQDNDHDDTLAGLDFPPETGTFEPMTVRQAQEDMVRFSAPVIDAYAQRPAILDRLLVRGGRQYGGQSYGGRNNRGPITERQRDLANRLEPFTTRNRFVQSIVDQHRAGVTWSPAQMTAAQSALDDMEARYGRRVRHSRE